MNDPSCHQRSGLSAIELMIVISVLAILAGMSTPGLLRALRHGQVHESANSIARLCGQARQLARSRVAAPEHYGVVVVNGDGTAPGYVAVTYGITASPATILMASGKPVSRVELPRGVLVLKGDTPLASGDAESGWVFDYQTGHCLADPVVAGAPPIDILGLAVSTVDRRYSRAIAIYRIGMVAIQED